MLAGVHLYKRKTMSKIKATIKQITGWIDYPGIDGFKVHLHFLNREDLQKIRKISLTNKIDRKTRQRVEEVDTDKFLQNYAKSVIKGWEGLKIKHLPSLIPSDISGLNPEEEIAYDEEEAMELLTNSASFDQFITDTLSDFETFDEERKETNSKN